MSVVRNLSDRDMRPQFEPEMGESASAAVVNLNSRRGTPAWEREIVSTLCRYLELPTGWDSYGGRPLRYDTGMFALQVLSSIMTESIPLPSVVPVGCGGVQFEWHQNGLDVELYIAAPYDCELSVYDHLTDGPQQVIPITDDFAVLIEFIRQLADFNRQHVHAA
jgi:hypothetical protein